MLKILDFNSISKIFMYQYRSTNPNAFKFVYVENFIIGLIRFSLFNILIVTLSIEKFYCDFLWIL